MSATAIPWLNILRLVVDVNIKGGIICLLAIILAVLLKRSAASLRNQIWVGTLLALLLLPLMSTILPMRNLSLLPDPRFWGVSAPAALVAGDIPADLPGDDFIGPRILHQGFGITKPFWVEMTWPHWLLAIWVMGLTLYGLWFSVGQVNLWRLRRRAIPTDSSWSQLLNSLSSRLGLNRKITLLRSHEIQAGVTMGVIKPVVIFPATAEQWPESRRRLVLSHELAHIKRWDSLIEIMISLTPLLYWFNPLVWYAIRQLRIERERDCDNTVLNLGAKPSDYAMQLMEIAANLGQSKLSSWQALPISQSSNLKDRLLYILDPEVKRVGWSWGSTMLSLLIVISFSAPLAAFGLWEGEDTALAQVVTGSDEAKKKNSVKSSWIKNKNSAAAVVSGTIQAEGIDLAVKQFYEMRSDQSKQHYFKEAEFNSLGYDLMNKGMLEEAIIVLRLNVKTYPDSWNVYDSLGEALVQQGDYQSALKYYRQSVKMGSGVEKKAKILIGRLEQALAEDDGGWSPDKIMYDKSKLEKKRALNSKQTAG
jgi:beta-lactamase regulating signal transducer with metallopeptidase domain